jgi:rfaE bifunctional protein nucleotidyltransferase chain/domain
VEYIYNKIKPIDRLKEIIDKLKEQNKTIVHCHGVFDLIHPGHIRHLAAAKKEGDILVVTITADAFVRKGPGRPIFNEQLRAETLAAMSAVDYVCINNAPTAVNCIRELAPHIYVKGQDYENKDQDLTGKIIEEEEAIKSVGGRMIFTRDITFSSSKLINEHLDVFPQETREYLKKISERYPMDEIVGRLKEIDSLKVLIIGDAIIDQYHYCESMGRSLKGHIVVTKYLSEESFAGGVFATANNVAGICREASMITILGMENQNLDFIGAHLGSNISPKYFFRPGSPTTIKRRYVDISTSRKMHEICYMNDNPIPKEQENEIVKYLKDIISDFDLVIVSDFGHGFLGKTLVDFICNHSKYLAINVQTNSANTGFNLVSKYARADYVSIDEPEIRLAAHEKHLNLNEVMKQITDRHDYRHLIVTRGAQGSLYYSKKYGFHESPALASKVVDTVGAGDAFFAYTAPCMALQFPPDLLSFIGNAVGALAVQIVCNREPVNPVDLLKFVNRLLK